MLQRPLRKSKSNTRLQESFLALSAVVMAAFYGIMGILLVTFPKMFGNLSPTTCLLFGSLLILYAAFRGYRAYKQWTELKM